MSTSSAAVLLQCPTDCSCCLRPPGAGYSKIPVSPPIINVGVAAATTSEELIVFDAGSGFMRYGQEAGALTCRLHGRTCSAVWWGVPRCRQFC